MDTGMFVRRTRDRDREMPKRGGVKWQIAGTFSPFLGGGGGQVQ